MAALGRRAEKDGRDARRRGLPLSLVIARYFAYAFAAVVVAWLAAFVLLSAAINTGQVYEASWGPAHAREVAAALAAESPLDAADVPTAYRYLRTDADGAVLESDLAPGAQRDRAEAAAKATLAAHAADADADADEVTIEGAGGATYASFSLADGGACVLVSEYLPQWVDRTWRDALPNPQNLMLATGALLSALMLALLARRASRVIARKMAPLAQAAARVGRQELDFAVERTNVREVNDVLDAMDAMRAELAASLEARWAAERAQREQVASLAHDLKTPLTVARANADFVAEGLAGPGAPDADARSELAGAAADIAAATERLDGYVHLLIQTSRGEKPHEARPVSPAALCARVAREAEAVARAADVELTTEVAPEVASAPEAALDADELARAAGNLVANAIEHARGRVLLGCSLESGRLVITVRDDGLGFSPAALEHGRERLFTDDSSRAARDGRPHYGIGLFAAAEAARAHGGALELSNDHGAVARLAVPV